MTIFVIQNISFEWLSGGYGRTTCGSFDPTTVKIPSLESKATFPAARTATTRALVSNEAVNGASVDGEGVDDVCCDDDARLSTTVHEDNHGDPASAGDSEVDNDIVSISMLRTGASIVNIKRTAFFQSIRNR